jgi:glycosyltransferase involved in cell wall biosynthesis
MSDSAPAVYSILHHPSMFSERSGMYPLVQAVEGKPLFHEVGWERLQARSWTLGHWLKRAGIRYSGSAWNALIPVWDEWRLSRRIGREEPRVVHFLWGEFARPSLPALFRPKQGGVVGTFHCSARRLPRVLGRVRSLDCFDHVTLMSRTQEPFFRELGVPPERLHVFLHGVDTAFFHPGSQPFEPVEGPLRGLLIGKTERDHAFMAQVLKRLPPGTLELAVSTVEEQRVHYRDAPGHRFLARMTDEELLDRYRHSDLLVMPMLDCTANNVGLEAMACGLPVMTNAVGGIPEYTPRDCAIVTEDKGVDEWVDRLKALAADRTQLWAWREQVRRWVEPFDWKLMARPYIDLFRGMAG